MSTAASPNGRSPAGLEPWLVMIPVGRLHPNPDNPREDSGDLKGLAASIRESGLKQPLLARPAPDIGPEDYYIEDGWRRYLTMRDWRTELPCHVQPAEFGDPAQRNVITALVTDIHRKHLNPVERAIGLGKLQDLGLDMPEISRVTGLHISTVSNGLALLELTDDTREKVRSGQLPVTEALKIIRSHRRRQRKKKGQDPERGARWDPDHFTAGHPLARVARAMCDAREHNSRRRRGGACDHCWEDAIRADQDKITRAQVALEAEARDRVRGRLEVGA